MGVMEPNWFLAPPAPNSRMFRLVLQQQQQVTRDRRRLVLFPAECLDHVLAVGRSVVGPPVAAPRERWPLRNYEPLNQRLEISRFPRLLHKESEPREILFMA